MLLWLQCAYASDVVYKTKAKLILLMISGATDPGRHSLTLQGARTPLCQHCLENIQCGNHRVIGFAPGTHYRCIEILICPSCDYRKSNVATIV